jgi:MFS family permease
MFAVAVLGELASRLLPARSATIAGLGLLMAGLAGVTLAFPTRLLPVLFLGAVLAGAGLGLSFLGALATVNPLVPDERRGELTAAFYGHCQVERVR